MKKNLMLIAAIFFLAASNSKAQSTQTFKENGYELIFINQDKNFNKEVSDRLVKAYFKVYPVLAAAYNLKVPKTVTFTIDTAYKGVAATSGGKVVFSSKYMTNKPGDIDVVTHEVMHIVQNYGNSVGPWWLTEGIADYVRYKYGIDNAGAKWSLPAYQEKQNYDNGYRVTARFLVWIENKVKSGTVKELDEKLRAHTFNDASWESITGKPLAALWTQYIIDPSI